MGISGEVDHANGDILDNRRSNLRAATRSENNSNRQKFSNGTPASKYKGVQFTHGKWAASIQKDKERKWLGYFKHEDSAAKAYDIAAKELHGEFAVLNFPDDNAALAAEKVLSGKRYQDILVLMQDITQLRKQLAAEREKVQRLESGTGLNAVIETNKQLREKVQTLVDALKEIADMWNKRRYGNDASAVARDELAKVEVYPLPDGRTK